MNDQPSDFVLFVGRFHPLLVHLPIGFLVLLGALELLACLPRFKQARSAAGLIAAMAVPASAFSAVCGWMLAQGGGYDETLLAWHRWTGTGVAAATAVVVLLRFLNQTRLYLGFLFGTLGLLAVASHFGGSLTHGSDYLTRYAPGPIRAWLSSPAKPPSSKPLVAGGAEERPVFAAAVQPVLEKYCLSCHGPEKSKAKLRLDSLEAIRKGGETGPAIEPGKSSASLLVKHVLLPLAAEDHMPPEGKPQPSKDDIALIQWWIDAGAPADKKASELKPPEGIRRILESRSVASRVETAAPSAMDTVDTTTLVALPPRAVSALLPQAEQLADELGIAITQLSQSEPWLQCNASLAATNFGDSELARLAPLAANLRWLDLTGTSVSDAGLAHVAAMKNLTRLYLARTPVSDAGLAQLAGLTELQYLNLYGTPVTDAGLAHLKPLAKLRQVYLWQTQVTTNGVKALDDQLVDKSQIQRWQEEIAALKARIKQQNVTIDLGVPVAASKPEETKPINARCPISDKDVDPKQTSVYEGKVVAFCCEKCKASFDKDSKPHLAKLGLAQPAAEAKASR